MYNSCVGKNFFNAVLVSSGLCKSLVSWRYMPGCLKITTGAKNVLLSLNCFKVMKQLAVE